MNPRLQRLQQIMRQTHTIELVEKLRYWAKVARSRGANNEFLRANPNFAVPPTHLAFDAYGRVNWQIYANSGKNDAERIAATITECSHQPIHTICEWGCGPARVIRHLPKLMPGCEVYGTDYNSESIAWCSQHIPNVHFAVNELNPPLPFSVDMFDFIYVISVFTHLSEKHCIEWMNELKRVSKVGGLLMIWTNSDRYVKRLLLEEQKLYKLGNFVVRDKYEEGKKMFLSFHPTPWVQNVLLKGCTLLKHLPGGFSGGGQDIWVARIDAK